MWSASARGWSKTWRTTLSTSRAWETCLSLTLEPDFTTHYLKIIMKANKFLTLGICALQQVLASAVRNRPSLSPKSAPFDSSLGSFYNPLPCREISMSRGACSTWNLSNFAKLSICPFWYPSRLTLVLGFRPPISCFAHLWYEAPFHSRRQGNRIYYPFYSFAAPILVLCEEALFFLEPSRKARDIGQFKFGFRCLIMCWACPGSTLGAIPPTSAKNVTFEVSSGNQFVWL